MCFLATILLIVICVKNAKCVNSTALIFLASLAWQAFCLFGRSHMLFGCFVRGCVSYFPLSIAWFIEKLSQILRSIHFWDTFWVSLGAILSEFGSLGPSCDHLGISKVNMCIPSFHCREFLAQNFNWPNHIKIEMQTFDTCTCVTEHSCYMHETFFRLRTQPHSNMWTFAHSICSPDHCHSVLLVVWFVWHRMYCTNIGRAWYYHFENLWFSTICWSLNPLVCLSPSVEYLAIVSRCCWQLAVIAMLQCCSCEIDFTLLAGRESWYKLAALILEKLSELVLQKQYHPMCA